MHSSLFTVITGMLSTGLQRLVESIDPNRDQQIEKFLADFRQEVARIFKNLRHARISLQGNSFKPFIVAHQVELMDLISFLLQHAHPRHIVYRDDTHPIHALCHDLYLELDRILLHIRHNYPKQFSHRVAIPLGYYTILRHELSRDLPGTIQALQSQKAEPRLLDIATAPLLAFIDGHPGKVFTDRDVLYLKTLYAGLAAIAQKPDLIRTPDRAIRTLLHTINFNAPDYEAYCFEYLDRKLADKPTVGDKILEVQRFITLLEKLSVDKDVRLYKRHDLKTSLRNGMESEIRLLEKQREIHPDNPPPHDTPAGGRNAKPRQPDTRTADKEDQPWRLKLTVDPIILTGLLSLLKEIVFFKATDDAVWVRFIHICFRTSEDQVIGFESTRKKFGKTAAHTWDTIVELLMAWLVLALKKRKEEGCTKKIKVHPELILLLK